MVSRSTEMPPVRLPRRQRQHRVKSRSAASVKHAHARSERLLLTIPRLRHVTLVRQPAHGSFSVGRCDRVASVGGSRPLASMALPFVQFTMPSANGGSFMQAVVAANRAGEMDEDKLDSSHAPLFNCALTTSFYGPNGIPVSFQYAQSLTEQRKLNPLHQYDFPPHRVSPAGVAPETDATARILTELRMLATWPRLRIATLPDPIVGGHDHDPTGVSERLGMKGLSVYSAFVEPESLRCHVCGDQSKDMALALLHQRLLRHFQH